MMNNPVPTQKTHLSFEVFPPKQDSPAESVYSSLGRLAELRPDFISVTFSAGGGGNTAYTAEIAAHIQNELHTPAVAHLTCLGYSRQEVSSELAELQSRGVRRIMALRGDKSPLLSGKHDFLHATDLISFIKSRGDFEIYAACYPECHSESASQDEDIAYLKLKADVGADAFVSQLFFDNQKYLYFLEKARAVGITIPIYAGIMPITGKNQIERMVTLSGASLPGKLTRLLAKYQDRPEALRDAGIAYAVEQITELLAYNCDGIHLYTMNKPFVAQKITESVASLL